MAEQSEAHADSRAPRRRTDSTTGTPRAGRDGRRADDPTSEGRLAAFAYAPGAPVAGNPVLFETDAPSSGADARYEWAFGDGATATGETASHVYDSAGEHAVALTVTDEGGATRTVRRSVTVYREVAVDVGDPDGDGLLAVTLRGLDGFDPADAVAVESLRVGAPTALAMGSGANAVRSETRDGDLRVRVRADETGLRDADSPARLAGRTTGGVPIAGTAEVDAPERSTTTP